VRQMLFMDAPPIRGFAPSAPWHSPRPGYPERARRVLSSAENLLEYFQNAIREQKQGAHRVEFREARFEDYEGISALKHSQGLASKPFDEWRRLWIGNPCFKEMRRWPIGWVLTDGDRIAPSSYDGDASL
jgi:hypothetical protein